MIPFKSKEEITDPEKINKVLQTINADVSSRLKLNQDGNLEFDGDIICNDAIFAESSIYLGKKDASRKISLVNDEIVLGGKVPVSNVEKSVWEAKQDPLVSGTNIKTINSVSILGSGDISASGMSQAQILARSLGC